VNAGFVAGEGETLIVDTGGNTLAAQTILGYAEAVRPGNRVRVINTEPHFDHIGGNSFFLRRGVEIFGHALLHRTAEEFAAEQAEFNAGIANPMRRAKGEEKAFFFATDLAMPDCLLEAETVFDLGGVQAEILFTPGHTKANLSVWIETERVLFVGDCVISEYLPNLDAGCPQLWARWQESLDRIAALQPEVIVPGHGPVLRGAGCGKAIEDLRGILRESIALGSSPTKSCCG
jgi:cyclase